MKMSATKTPSFKFYLSYHSYYIINYMQFTLQERDEDSPVSRSKFITLNNRGRSDPMIRLTDQFLAPTVAQVLPRNCQRVTNFTHCHWFYTHFTLHFHFFTFILFVFLRFWFVVFNPVRDYRCWFGLERFWLWLWRGYRGLTLDCPVFVDARYVDCRVGDVAVQFSIFWLRSTFAA